MLHDRSLMDEMPAELRKIIEQSTRRLAELKDR